MSSIEEICSYFKNDPVGYASVVLGIRLTKDQESILESLCIKPYHTLVRSANNLGKSFIAAVAACYMFDCWNPSITLITAPTMTQIENVIFKEMRSLLAGRNFGRGKGFAPKAAELFDTFNHCVLGITATSADAFKGRHDAAISIICEELTAVEPTFVDVAHTMLAGEGHFFLGIFNPVDQASKAFTCEMDAYRSKSYHVIELSALKHENIINELQGLPAAIPNAIRLEQLRNNIALWCEEVVEPQESDFEFDGKWWKPGPNAECCLLGRWPSQAATNIWTLSMFQKCCEYEGNFGHPLDIQCGVDFAAYGNDDSCIAIRKGECLIHVEAHNGWGPMQLCSRVKTLVDEMHKRFGLKQTDKIQICCDDTGIGAAAKEHFQDTNYCYKPINFSGRSHSPHLYRHRRDEIHFTIADRARKGNVSFKHVPKWISDELRTQLLAPKYKMDLSGKRVVEPKDKTKELLGKSPDMADAVLLSFMEIGSPVNIVQPQVIKEKRKWLV